jgi:hypothetical protein
MHNNNFFSSMATTALCLLSIHCATTNAPDNWLPEPEASVADPYGGWVDIETREGRSVSGELIAVSTDTVYVADSSVHAIGTNGILKARLVYYDAGTTITTGAFLGPFVTLSNGLFLVFTLPMWIIGGPIAASSRSYDPIVDYPKKPLADFAKYSRFPQGLPPDLDLASVKMKKALPKESRSH